MGVTKVSQEFSTPVAARRVFRALILESNTLMPKLLPQSIKSVEVLQGDGGAGSIELVNFTETSNFKYMKNRIDELDIEQLVCKYTMIESDAMADLIESISYEITFEESEDGGCVCKMTSEYRPFGGYKVKEEDVKAGKESAMAIYKVVEAYLLENPDIYA